MGYEMAAFLGILGNNQLRGIQRWSQILVNLSVTQRTKLLGLQRTKASGNLNMENGHLMICIDLLKITRWCSIC